MSFFRTVMFQAMVVGSIKFNHFKNHNKPKTKTFPKVTQNNSVSMSSNKQKPLFSYKPADIHYNGLDYTMIEKDPLLRK